jgi:hypothetical protein
MKNLYTLLIAFILLLPTQLAFSQEKQEFVPALNEIWTEELTDDEMVTEFTRGDECYILIRKASGEYQDGITIRTTKKPTREWGGVTKKTVIQWKFYVLNILGKEKYSFSFWGEKYAEETGPEISANCEKYLPELLPSIQKILQKYGAMK